MFEFDPQKCLLELRQAQTDDLLDRVTAYRNGMEARAVELIEHELRRRGVNQGAIDARNAECQRDCTFDSDGVALACSLCRRPAVLQIVAWHRLFGLVPIFPRPMRYCEEHQPTTANADANEPRTK